jgi:hypothetical protein
MTFDQRIISFDIFIYRGEESDDNDKEICINVTILKDPFTTRISYEILVTVTCYHYGSWSIARGPILIKNFTLIASNY